MAYKKIIPFINGENELAAVTHKTEKEHTASSYQ